jgi:hypothetical protein
MRLDSACTACPSGFTCDGAAATVCDSTKYAKDKESKGGKG